MLAKEQCQVTGEHWVQLSLANKFVLFTMPVSISTPLVQARAHRQLFGNECQVHVLMHGGAAAMTMHREGP